MSENMNARYIAGFFDGEGSAMILTIRRMLKTGTIYRFRPVIRISQKNPEVLLMIRNYLGYGHVVPDKKCHLYVVNGIEGILQFVKKINSHCFIKRKNLLAVGKFAQFQLSRQENFPYTLEETIKMLDIRDGVFELNKLKRTGLKQKYPRDQILAETNFIKDINQWQLKRGEKGLRAMIEKGKSFRFKKGNNCAAY